MKKITLFMLLFSATMFSQKLTKEQLHQKMADETCQCMSSKDLDTEGFESVLESCMMTSYNKYKADVEKHYGKNAVDNEEVMYKFGTEIGKIMGADCPEVFASLMGDSDDEEYVDEEELVFEGKMTLINKAQQFLSFSVKDNGGASKEFTLMEEFDGAELLTTDKLKVNDKVSITYYESEMYDPKTKKYKIYNVVYNIEKLK